MSLAAQAKVLRVLQEGVVTRIGGAKTIAGGRARARGDQQGPRDRRSPRGGSARISTTGSTWCRSTCRRCASAARTFRCWSRHFAERWRRACRRAGREVRRTTRSRGCSALDWPGNMRELRNAVERLLILAPGQDGHRGGHRPAAAGAPTAASRPRTPAEPRPSRVQAGGGAGVPRSRSCASTTGTCRRRRARSKMPRSNLYKKIERYGLTRESHDRAAAGLGQGAGQDRQGRWRRQPAPAPITPASRRAPAAPRGLACPDGPGRARGWRRTALWPRRRCATARALGGLGAGDARSGRTAHAAVALGAVRVPRCACAIVVVRRGVWSCGLDAWRHRLGAGARRSRCCSPCGNLLGDRDRASCRAASGHADTGSAQHP